MATTVWKGHLTFGLISLPVRLYRAARKEKVSLRYLHQATSDTNGLDVDQEVEPRNEIALPEEVSAGSGSILNTPHEPASTTPLFEQREPDEQMLPVTPVQREFRNAANQQAVERQELVKGFEYAPEQYVVLSPEELRRLRPKTSPEMQILRSVRLAEIDPVYFESSYYIIPDRAGERAYALLFAALQKAEHVALAKVTMHGREHIIVVRPGRKGLLAHTMYYNDEIRAENEFQADLSLVQPKELELAMTFVDAIASPFMPEEFKDAYREQLQALIAGKIERKDVATSASPAASAAAPVVDLMEALRRSLDTVKKVSPSSQKLERRAPGKAMEVNSKTQRRRKVQ